MNTKYIRWNLDYEFWIRGFFQAFYKLHVYYLFIVYRGSIVSEISIYEINLFYFLLSRRSSNVSKIINSNNNNIAHFRTYLIFE